MSEPATQQRVSLAAATAIVVATMVGVGVFVSLGYQVKPIPSGFPILALWAIGGVVALCGALCYAELATMMPRSGGEYHLLGQAYHPMVGFLAGWISIVAGFAAPIASAAKFFQSYSERSLPGVDGFTLSVLLLLGVMCVQLGGLRFLDRFQVSSTVLKLLLILAFVAGALWVGTLDWSRVSPKAGDSQLYLTPSYASALVYVMYAYTGWNCAVYVAGEMENPRRNIPLALLLGTGIVMLLYVALNAVFLMTAPEEQYVWSNDVAIVSGEAIFGSAGARLVAALIALGLIPHVNGMLFAGTRVMQVLGQDERLLRWFTVKNRRGVPYVSVLLMTALILVLIIWPSINDLINYIAVLLLLCSLLAVLAVPWLRWKRPDLARPFKTPLYPLPPILFSITILWMLYYVIREQPIVCLWGLATLLIGSMLYGVARLVDRNPGPKFPS